MISWSKRHKGSGIIYKENRKGCERLAETLRSEGIDAMAFHAEMRDADKKRVQDGFLAGHPRVICATSAFGMGVDKPDVRWVLNDGPCKSLEAYWQAEPAGTASRPTRSSTGAPATGDGCATPHGRRKAAPRNPATPHASGPRSSWTPDSTP